MADRIYDLGSVFTNLMGADIVGEVIEVAASLVGQATNPHHIIPLALFDGGLR